MKRKIDIFARSKPSLGQLGLSIMLVGIFYACIANIRQSVPCIHYNGVCNPSQWEVLTAGHGLPFFSQPYKLNSFKMSKTNEVSSVGLITPNQNRATCESGIQTFSFDHDTTVEVVTINGEPWFVAVDICNALDLQNPSARLKEHLQEDEYLPYEIRRSGQNRIVNVVSESGLYVLIFQSRKPNAQKFRKWVTKEVLPSIRKTGMYATPETAEKLSGRYICINGVDDNLYLLSLFKAFKELVDEEIRGNTNSEIRFAKKYEAGRILFPNYREDLRKSKIMMKSN